jgi:23S rRNA (cytidine1920-2'-O)/16S rRNA (cytidine1409-2'-O)-methyltransferase
MTKSASQRLDQALVARGLAATRARARDQIVRGCVRVDGATAAKPGQLVQPDAAIEVADPAAGYASRGALKLLAALDAFGLDPGGRVALDIGASTGGFTDVLLARGARRVYAVDVGHGQLIARLAADERVVELSSLDARRLTPADVPEPVGAIVADVSFISLTKALPAALALAASGAWLALLVKPQFELEPKAIGKGGIVADPADVTRAVDTVRRWLSETARWRVLGTLPSPIVGKDGNVEHLIGAVNSD